MPPIPTAPADNNSPELIYSRGRIAKLVRRLLYDERGVCDQVLGLQEPLDGRFGHVILGSIGVFDGRLSG